MNSEWEILLVSLSLLALAQTVAILVLAGRTQRQVVIGATSSAPQPMGLTDLRNGQRIEHRAGKARLLVLLSPACPSCQAMVPVINRVVGETVEPNALWSS